ncbi:MAG: glycosyltransferase family 2 protein [Candidatus Krumholzibacteriales bacterium]
MQNNNITISIVSPFFNEEEMVDTFVEKIREVMSEIGKSFEIICVNDGSTDNTLSRLIRTKKTCPDLRIINLSRNFGKEAALTAGLDHARGEAVIPIDADLQDPPELIKEFVSNWEAGVDVVLAQRIDRSSDSAAKRITARLFYKLHNRISYLKIPADVGDFRLMSKRVVEAVRQLPENQRFMKGIFSWVGFRTKIVEYQRPERSAGATSFNGWKLWNLALEGITDFSTVPLRIWLYIGLVISFLSFIFGSFIILKTLITGVDVPGYASLITIILFLGGIQLIGIGILGEYIGRIYMEAKRRPIYVVENEY